MARPMTLQAVMQESVGAGLRERYKPEQEIPHGLLVLLMQIKDDKVRAAKAAQAEQTRGRIDKATGSSPGAWRARSPATRSPQDTD
jgi:hypothetical protein